MKKIISVVVKAGSSESKLEYHAGENIYHAYVKAKPEKGRANAELLNLVRKEFGMNAAIAKGFASKKKLIELWR